MIHRRFVVASGAVAFALIGAGLVVGGRVAFTVLPKEDGDILLARVQFLPGITVEQARRAVEQLETAAEALNDRSLVPHAGEGDLVLKKFSLVGEWSGWIEERGSHLCEVMIELIPSEIRQVRGDVVQAAWQQQVGIIDDAVTVTFDRLKIGPADKPLEIRLLGDDLDQLRRAADETVAKLGEYAGVSSVEHDLLPGKREVRVELKPLARTLGVSVDDLARQLRSGFFGGEAVRIQRGRSEARVQVRYPDEQRRSVADIENIRIRGAGGEEILFTELADYSVSRGFASIRRQDGKRRVRVVAEVDERRTNAERILGVVASDFLPDLCRRYPGISYRLEGQHAQLVESTRSLFAGLVVALIGIYALLATVLRSYALPMVIMAAIPLGFVGSVLGHWISGYDLTFLSLFGMVAVSGIVVNDSLVLLDRILQSVRQGTEVFDAVVEGAASRFRAVFLTTITTIVGLVPLLLERSTQAQMLIPMAISLVFGLACATVLTLVVTPSLYVALNDARRFGRWLLHGGAYPSAESMETMTTKTAAS